MSEHRPSVTRAAAPATRTAPGPAAPPPAAPTDAQAPRPPRRRTFRPLLLRLHFYAGILVAPLLVVAAVTGLLYTAAPTIEPVVNREQLRVAVPAGGKTLPLARQVAAARRAEPRGTITMVVPPPEPGGTTRVNLDGVPGVKTDYQRTVFVDPYRGAVTGELTTYGEWLPLRAWLDELHRNLHLGAVGRVYSETAASWLWLVALGGLGLWVARRRSTKKLRRLAVADRGATGRRRTVSFHGALGAWLVVGMLGLSVTGLTWSQFAGENVGALRERLSWTQPEVTTTAPAGAAGTTAADAGATGAADGAGVPAADDGAATHAAHGDPAGGHAGHGADDATGHGAHGGGSADAGAAPAEGTVITRLDEVAGAAAGAGLRAPMEITVPEAAGDAFAVAENKRTWPVRQDAVAVDGATARVLETRRFADWPFMAKAARWGIDGHMGLLFGVVNQLLLAALALGIIAMTVLGYRMWWMRRPTKDRLALGRAWPRGAWRDLPRWAWVVLPVAAVLIGVFVPLLGVTLAAFLVVDAALGVRARRREGRPAGPTP